MRESTGHSIALIPRGGALVRRTAAATPPPSATFCAINPPIEWPTSTVAPR
jgi:hypothetical protein